MPCERGSCEEMSDGVPQQLGCHAWPMHSTTGPVLAHIDFVVGFRPLAFWKRFQGELPDDVTKEAAVQAAFEACQHIPRCFQLASVLPAHLGEITSRLHSPWSFACKETEV